MIWQKPCFIPPYIRLNQKRLLWSSVIGYSSVWNNAKKIYLSDHQTIAFQCSMPKVTFIESAQYTLHILVQRFSSFINLINSIHPFTYTGNIRKQTWNQLSQWRPLHSENLMTVVCSMSSRSRTQSFTGSFKDQLGRNGEISVNVSISKFR